MAKSEGVIDFLPMALAPEIRARAASCGSLLCPVENGVKKKGLAAVLLRLRMTGWN